MTDTDLRHAVLAALDYDPSLDAADIAVSVEDGTVTLAGHVPTFTQKRTAERIVSHVKGVRAIAEEIEVRPPHKHVLTDDVLAHRALDALRHHTSIPEGAVQVTVEKGRVTLTGSLPWAFQRTAATEAIGGLTGVRAILNQIVITARPTVPDTRRRIEAALARDALLEGADIRVDVSGRAVTLDGAVHCLAERTAAERAAWSAPGVTQVIDRLAVRP